MWIRNFDLDDFGCFQRSRLLDLDDGLTVISGPQRAGKTTFMLAMRKLGYGISTGDDIPPANQEYRLAADIVHGDTECDISVSGFAEPRLFSDDGSIELDDIYGTVTGDQYRQLFTISLNQLRRTPPGIAEREELSAILLGAGYGDIAQIPEIKSDFAENAAGIGGKHGRAVYDMKGPVETIETGIEARVKAKAHVDDYRATKAELDEVQSDISGIEESEAELNLKKDRLATLEANYDDFAEYRQLDQELADENLARVDEFPLSELDSAARLADTYEAACSELAETQSEFQRLVESEDIDSHRESLLEIASDIERYNQEISGWQNQLDTLRNRENELQEKWVDLSHRASSLNGEWDEDPESALDVSLDSLTEDTVSQIAGDFNSADRGLTEARKELEEERAKLKETEQQLEEATDETGDNTDVRKSVVRITGLSGAGIIIGALIGLIMAPKWGLVAMGLVVGVAIGYAYVTLLRSNLLRGDSPVSQLRTEKNRLEAEISSIESKINSAREERKKAEAELDDLRDTLYLPTEVTAGGVMSYYRDLDRLQDDLRAAKAEEKAIAEEYDKLQEELLQVKNTIDPVTEVDIDEVSLIESANKFFEAIRSASDELDQARIVEENWVQVERLETEIFEVLSKWNELDEVADIEDLDQPLDRALTTFLEDGEKVQHLAEKRDTHDELESRLRTRFDRQAVREAFAPICLEQADSEADNGIDLEEVSIDQIIEAAEYDVDQYVDDSAIREELDRIEEELDELSENRQTLIEEQTELKRELETLASDEDIVAAQETIERGRQQLRPLAERYAEYRIAEYLVDELHEHFIEEATGPLLNDATGLFEHITNEYTDVNHTGSLDDLGFEAIRVDGTVHSSTELSRATAEQLFLAVRIARIQQLDVSLPVVLDDSMTNFDPPHLTRTLDLVEELAETNQVFFLTCHPEFIEKAAESVSVKQFWTLEDGTFEGPFNETEPLISVLTEG